MSQASTLQNLHKKYLSSQQDNQQQAVEIIKLVLALNTKDIQIDVLSKNLSNKSVNQIIAIHHEAELELNKSIELLTALVDSDVSTAQVDLGQFFLTDTSVTDAVSSLAEITKNNAISSDKITDVVLYGFGRIGRILTRLLLDNTVAASGLQLKAIVVRPAGGADLFKRAKLLVNDTAHGDFDGSIELDETNNSIIINGRLVQVIYAKNPNEIDYTSYGIDNALVIDNTGIWTDEESLSKHLESQGVKKVLLTAPAKGNIKNVVFNVNNDTIGNDTLVSAASCTTNAITPSLKVLNDKFGITSGHLETIHSYTNDQNLIDNYHKKDRRGRSAALNMVITTTGAAKAVGKAYPELNGKLTGNAIRVPTPNVSMAILNLNLETAPASKEELNNFFIDVAKSTKWQKQIGYTDSTEAVSSDFMSTQTVGIIDTQATILTDNHATIYIWYDNEVGYSTQVLRIAKQMAGYNYALLPTA